jgi:hypothetical protein
MAIPKGDGYASTGPASEAVILTTNATTSLDPYSRAIYIGTDGTLEVTLAWTTASIALTVVAGAWLPIRAKSVQAAPAGSFAFW